MKKFFFMSFITCCLSLAAYAADEPMQISRAGINRAIVVSAPAAGNAQTGNDLNNSPLAGESAVPSRTPVGGINDTPVISRTAISRTGVVAPTTNNQQPTTVDQSRAGAARGVSTVGRVGVTGGTAARAAMGEPNDALRNDASGRNQIREAQSANAQPQVRRAGVSLRPSTAEVGGRAVISGTNKMTGTNIGKPSQTRKARAADEEAFAGGADAMGAQMEVTESCRVQYMDCMDQFCNVIDQNQKRCSCSSRISSYADIEKKVKEGNTQLNEIAQRIRYVGLSGEEIRAIMKATEAELELQRTADRTESRRMLEKLEKTIRSPSGGVSESRGDRFGMDFDFNTDFFSGDPADIFNLFNKEEQSFANMRGADLFKNAQKRCKNILDSCKKAGANVSIVTGRYDIEIDKDCIAYEKGLEKMNATLANNIRVANQMLQNARLDVLDDHNRYDMKECVGALEACMTDEMVCGENYAKCMDPTKRYLDENGQVVLGQNVARILDFMETYNNAAISLNTAWSMNGYTNCDRPPNNDGRCIIKYLMSKIDNSTTRQTIGLCRPVLDKCRRYSHDANGKYKRDNEVVLNYIQRAMVNIRGWNARIISEYASTCLGDIATCYGNQVSQIQSWSQNASIQNVISIMMGACRNVALTCSYAIFQQDQDSCPTDGNRNSQNICIESVSNIFYQSMLCPEGSEYTPQRGIAGRNGYVNERCVCKSGYELDKDGDCSKPKNEENYCPILSDHIRTFDVLSDPGPPPVYTQTVSEGSLGEVILIGSTRRTYASAKCICAESHGYNADTGRCSACPVNTEFLLNIGGGTTYKTCMESKKCSWSDSVRSATSVRGCLCEPERFWHKGACRSCPANSSFYPNPSETETETTNSSTGGGDNTIKFGLPSPYCICNPGYKPQGLECVLQ